MSVLTLAVLSCFGLAVAAPLVAARTRWAGAVLGLLPLALTGLMVVLGGQVVGGMRVFEATPWAPSLGLHLAFALDGLSLLFGLLILGIGSLVLVYAGEYLAGHPQLGRLFALVLIFMGAMLGIVLADNLLLLYVFWALTSISSYLLIGFDHERAESRSSALQALLVTVAGEFALLGGLVLLGQVGGTMQISTLLERGDQIRADPLYTPIVVLIVAGAVTKSAQFPFHFWLPNAMAAPTPVSAYLHSATMVKAGVYLLARLTPTLGGTELWLALLTAAGAVTMLLGAFLSLRSSDFKRILAYSTVSALGIMVFLLGLGTDEAAGAAIVFLLAHALYKGALFLVAGAVDHATGVRDVDRLSGLHRAMPVTAAVAVLAAVSMAGFLPLFGFIGKELLYEATLELPGAGVLLTFPAVAANILLVGVAALVGVRPFFGRLPASLPQKPREPPVSLWLGAAILAGLGLVTGVAPALVATPLVAAAASAVIGRPADIDLALWHGLTPILLLSVVTLGAGVALFLGRKQFRSLTTALDLGPRLGPERWWEAGFAAVQSFAGLQTRLLQNGYLRHYMQVTLLTVIVLVGAALVRAGGLGWTFRPLDLRPHEMGVAAVIMLAALVAVRSSSRLGMVAALGVVGYGVALVYLLFGAPDLAMAQVLIETLTVVVFVLVLYHLPPFASLSAPRTRVRDAVVSVGAGVLMGSLVLATITDQARTTVSTFFIANALPEGHGRNIVNVILVDFRALDTLAEITVLALAGLGVYALLRLRPGKRAAP